MKITGYVLVVEDETQLSALVKISLEKQGYQVQTCGSVTEAISRSDRQAFDCIVLDLRLEKGNGEQFLEYIRSTKKNLNHSTPVVITSGFLDPHLLQELKGKVNGVLVKPFSQDQLVQRITKLVAEYQTRKPKIKKEAS